jgi:uncharacterized protein
MVALVLGSILRALFGRLPAAVLTGSFVGGIAWLIVASVGVALVVALIAFLLTLFGDTPTGGRRYRRGPVWDGGWSGGGGGGSGGGWSGGGGSFGGGGASGRW